MSSSAPSKTQSTETSKPDVDPAQTSKTASNQAPTMLEEDDEFEDFPVEGTERSPEAAVKVMNKEITDGLFRLVTRRY